jgi:hypothetical protein
MRLTALLPTAGFAISAIMLAFKLPMASVSPMGVALTLAFYALNPPFFLVQLFAPHDAHELEHSSWAAFQYPIAFLVSAAWWSLIAWLLHRRHNRVGP